MGLEADQGILNGKYRIIRMIGQGGMGRVWLAEEIAFGRRRVAIKEPRDDTHPEDRVDVQARYRREVQVGAVLAQAKAPNIVHALTAEPYDGGILLVMEYLPGGDLAALLRQHPDGLTVEKAVSITLDVLRALEAAHSHSGGIIHRDVKPSNIVFDGDERAHLADFGVAQVAIWSERTRPGHGLPPCTPLYSAPEQIAGVDVLTPAADVYALGCVLFEMITGRAYKQVRPGTLASDLRLGVPRWFDGVLARALAEDRWSRWQGATEIMYRLSSGTTAVLK